VLGPAPVLGPLEAAGVEPLVDDGGLVPAVGGAACGIWALAWPEIDDMIFPKMLMIGLPFTVATIELCTEFQLSVSRLLPGPMAETSKLLCPKSVAAWDVACLQAGHEPTRALCRCAMGERVRDYITLGLPL